MADRTRSVAHVAGVERRLAALRSSSMGDDPAWVLAAQGGRGLVHGWILVPTLPLLVSGVVLAFAWPLGTVIGLAIVAVTGPLVRQAWRQATDPRSLVLTPSSLVLVASRWALCVPWDGISGPARSPLRGATDDFVVLPIDDGAAIVSGRTPRWHWPRKHRAGIGIVSKDFAGDGLVLLLLDWCVALDDRSIIGTDEGRAQLRSMLLS